MITRTQKYLLSKLPKHLIKNIRVNEDACWIWQTNINGTGYGRVSVCVDKVNKRIVAHKYMYKLLKGGYQKGLVLDHVYCSDKRCCNPTHVSPITSKQNTHRGKAVLFKKGFKMPIDKNPDWFSDLLT